MEAWPFCRAYPQPGDEVHPGAIIPCYKPKDHDDNHTWELRPVPAVRDYEVVQERRVTVVAESPTHAIEVAKPVFDAGGADPEHASGVRSELKETDIRASEAY